MASQCFSLVRGRVLRATALDGCGRPSSGACSSIVSEGFISVGFTANTDAGDEISVKNAAGKICIQDTPCPVFKGYTVEVAFCEVNPALYAMLTGQETVFNGAGDAVGFRVNSDISACDSGVALELWSSVPGVKCSEDASAEGSFGYLLVPFLQGGTLGDFTFAERRGHLHHLGCRDQDRWRLGHRPVQRRARRCGHCVQAAHPDHQWRPSACAVHRRGPSGAVL